MIHSHFWNHVTSPGINFRTSKDKLAKREGITFIALKNEIQGFYHKKQMWKIFGDKCGALGECTTSQELCHRFYPVLLEYV